MPDEKVTALSLTQFLLDNPQVDITEDVYVAERFKNAGLKFTISAMSGEQFSAYQKEATAIGRHKKVNFDSKRFNELVVINHTVNPNFKDADTIKKAGCQTPEQFLYRSLRAGEVVELANQISRLSGFDTDPEALVDEVKNS
jgi:predicted component of type VI protein secretion system